MIVVYGLHKAYLEGNNFGIENWEGDTVKKHILVAAILAMLASISISASAQGPGKGQTMDRSALIPECSTLERLDLSATQREALKRIDENSKNQVLRHRNSLMVKRIELLGLLRDPDAEKQAIQAKAREMGDVREALQKEMIDYQIQIRGILTPEQIRRWCTMMGEPQGGWKGDSWCK
jgi:Spy/CpxP family protein refolding chaperone